MIRQVLSWPRVSLASISMQGESVAAMWRLAMEAVWSSRVLRMYPPMTRKIASALVWVCLLCVGVGV